MDETNYDIWLEHSSSKLGYRLAKDDNGNPQFKELLAPFVAPQISQGAYTYDSNDATVNVPVAIDSWRGGCGFAAIPGAEPLGKVVYALAAGIDASWADGLMLSPKKQTGGSTTQAPIKFVYSSFGTHVMTTRYVYEWTGAAWTSRFDNTNKTNTDLVEYKNSRGTYLVLTLSDDNYYISTDGVTFSQPNSGALYPTYRSSASNGGMITGTLVIDKPSGAAVDDVLFAAISIYSNTVTTPSGWTLIESRTSSTWHTYYFYKRVTETEPTAYAFVQSGTIEMAGTIVCYQGCATSGTPYENASYSTANSGTTWTTSNTQNCTGYDRTILTLVAGGESATSTTGSWTTAAGYTERVDVAYAGTTPNVATVAAFDKVNQDPGLVSSATFTYSRSLSADGLATQYLLKPVEGSSALSNGMRLAIRGSSDGEPLLWCVDSNGGIRNTPDPTHPGMWSNPDTIQFSQPVTIRGLEVNDNVFYLFHNKGIDSYDGTTISTVWNNTTLEQESDGARPYTWVDQNIYFTYSSSLFQFNTTDNIVSKIWPQSKQLSVPTRTGTITSITGDGKNLYFTLKNLDGDYFVMKCDPYVRFTLDGVEYMPVFDIIANSTNAMAASIVLPPASDTFHTTRPQLVVGYGTNAHYYILPKYGSSPYNDSSYKFDDSAAMALYGTYVDAGASIFPKFLNSISAIRADVDATYNIGVNAQCNLIDGTTSTQSHSNNTLGVSNTTVTSDIEFTSLRPYITMRTSADTATTLLTNIVFNTSLNPARFKMWEVVVELDENLERMGGGDSRWSIKSLRDHLYNGATERVTFYDRLNTSYVTRILNIESVSVGKEKLLYKLTLVQLI